MSMRALTLSGLAAGLLACALLVTAHPAGAQQAQVRAVLFFSPTCPHCHDVMERDLPPLMDRFGEQLQIVSINAATPEGGRLYQDMVAALGVPRERLGVPALVVGERLLVGSQEIPQLLPGLITAGLAAGGADWPAVRSIRDAVARAGLLQPLPDPAEPDSRRLPAPDEVHAPAPADAPAALPAPAAEVESSHAGPPAAAQDTLGAGATGGPSDSDTAVVAGAAPPLVDLAGSAAPATMLERLMRDPVGNGAAVVILAGLLLVMAWSLLTVRRGATEEGQVPAWLIPALVVMGAGVAGYLSFIEVTGSTAVCGPVGDCNTVQQSQYASLFGFLPVGVLGLLGYLAIGAIWLVWRKGPPRYRDRSSALLYAAALAGAGFSVYLTFLEPFVIGASCAWCLTSAAVIAVILMAATPPAALLRARAVRS
jgi:uncharacterized membrane protein/thiol-disulfide isomerase/thioredoxin